MSWIEIREKLAALQKAAIVDIPSQQLPIAGAAELSGLAAQLGAGGNPLNKAVAAAVSGHPGMSPVYQPGRGKGGGGGSVSRADFKGDSKTTPVPDGKAGLGIGGTPSLAPTAAKSGKPPEDSGGNLPPALTPWYRDWRYMLPLAAGGGLGAYGLYQLLARKKKRNKEAQVHAEVLSRLAQASLRR